MEIKIVRLEDKMIGVSTLGKITRDGWTSQRDPFGELFGPDIYNKSVLLSLGLSEAMDSTGVEWLLAAHRRFQAAGGKLVVHSAKPVMNQILKMMRIDLVLNLAPDETAARAMCTGEKNGN